MCDKFSLQLIKQFNEIQLQEKIDYNFTTQHSKILAKMSIEKRVYSTEI